MWSGRGGVSVLGCGLEACGMPDLREICREQTIYVNKQCLLRAVPVVSQWRLLIGNGAGKWRDKRRETEQASREGK